MTSSGTSIPSKRLQILDEAEIVALYDRPRFTADEQIHYFTLTQPEKDVLPLFRSVASQLFFLLQLSYFKAKQLFFTFAFAEVTDDVQYLIDHLVPEAQGAVLEPLTKPTILKQRDVILDLFQYRLCGADERAQLVLRARNTGSGNQRNGESG